nr:hypothetical protein [Tanacetum cinerariifolium]
MSMGRVFKTCIRRWEVKQSGEINIEFKIVDEYTVKVNKIKERSGGGCGVAAIVVMVAKIGAVWWVIGDCDDGVMMVVSNGDGDEVVQTMAMMLVTMG